MDRNRERLFKLLDLQKIIAGQYDEDTYNVFVFGSYVTKGFVEGESDVDIAVYTEDVSAYFAMTVIIKEFFDKLGIEQDIFYIDTSVVVPLFAAPLNSPIMFTDYYPEHLKEYKRKCGQLLVS